jgi:hypothetical protein
MRYTIKHTIATDVDTFWSKIFFDADFNRMLFVDVLGFTTYEVVENRVEASGVVHRRVECVPKIELPAAARKVLGDSTGYTEVGRYDPSAKKYFVEVLPKMGGEKIKTKSEIWVESRGDKSCERMAMVDNTVKIFGLGSIVEGFIEQQTRDLYDKGAEFTNRWIKDRGL